MNEEYARAQKRIAGALPELCAMADDIFDHPELQNREYRSAGMLADWLEAAGFQVKRGLGSLDTAFRAELSIRGAGGSVGGSGKAPVFGLLCEYDALADMGHACAHHLQGPAMLAAAAGLAGVRGHDFTVVVYGTPAEEGGRGKRVMIEEGWLRDVDVAIAMHGADRTTAFSASRAVHRYDVTFRGRSSHAAASPEEGRSALDALQLANIGIEFLREHLPDDARIHYSLYDLSQNPNIVPARASGQYLIRSLSERTVEDMRDRFLKIVEGAALMTGTEYEIIDGNGLKSTRPNLPLMRLLTDRAEAAGAAAVTREVFEAGSTDFGDVTQAVPGALLYTAFVPPGTGMHSQGFLDAGKSAAAHEAIRIAAEAAAGTCLDILENRALLEEIREAFRQGA